MKLKQLAASLLAFSCLFACACGDKGGNGGVIGGNSSDINSDSSDIVSGSGGDNGDNGDTSIGGILVEPEAPVTYVEGTLHEVNVDYDAPISDFVVNGQTNYQVVIGGADRGKASGLITEHLYKAFGARISVISIDELTEFNANSRYIFLGCEDYFAQCGYEMPDYDTLGIAGYQIKTVNKSVFINGYAVDGWQMGAIAFLRETIGYDMMADDLVIYELDGKKMPTMDIVERPDFDYRQPNGTSVSFVESFGMGYTYVDPIINTGENFCHNIYDFVSLEEMDEHPDWASNDSTRWQLCYTSRGNKDTYKEMVQHIANKIIGHLKAHPDKDTMILGQHDIGANTPMVQNCKCTSCQASYEYYGTFGAAWMSLCNRASILVDEYLKTDEAIAFFGGEKKYNLLQLVYHTQVNPPIESDQNGYIWDENGVGIPKVEMWFNNDGTMEAWEDAWSGEDEFSTEEEVVKEWSDRYERLYAAPNVHYMYATSAADWTHSYLDIENYSWMNIAKGWAGVHAPDAPGGEFFVWAYTLNSEYLLYPYNSFDNSWETTRFFKQLGAKYMFWQSQYHNKNNSGFVKLRNYLDSKVEFDVNADREHYVNKFFKYFYGVSGEYLQRFFDETVAHCRWIEVNNQVNGNIHNTRLGYAENWPEGTIQSWMDLLEKAYDAVEQEYKVKDPEKYEVYKNHIMIEELFPLYVQCTTYAESYATSELKAKRNLFLKNFYALNNTHHAEGRVMTLITDAWDLD